jgi:hypothetical protein
VNGSDVDVKTTTQRSTTGRNAESRSRPFAAVLLVALVAIPMMSLLLRTFVALGDGGIKWLIVWLVLLFGGLGLPAVTIGIGYRVTHREPLVIVHGAVTWHLLAVALSLSVLPGWQHVPGGSHWWDRAAAGVCNIFSVPLWAIVTYTIISLAVAGSWLTYRLDSFRASTAMAAVAEAGAKLMELVKWPKGASIRSIESDDFAVTATVDHEGIPLREVQRSLAALEECGFVRGAGSVVGGEKGGSGTKMRFVHTDPYTEWREWPGLSHPGGLFHEPLRTSYYVTGEDQWYSFVRTPDGYRSPHAPDFASPAGTFKGTQGATGSGKSGDGALEQAEVLSRRDVQLIYVDPAKLLQNASWCLEWASLAAGSRTASGALFDAMRELGKYRADVLGAAGVRDFDADAVKKTGLSWIYVFADEFDAAKQGADIKWLATKGRSLGFRFSFTLPRAASADLDTGVRAAVGMWGQFGLSQDHDKGFVLSAETVEAGANPARFGVTTPGAHYLDGAPGVSRSKYAIDCRSYKTRQDYSDLRAAVMAARAKFTPMTWTPGELNALGDVARQCSPAAVLRGGHSAHASGRAETTLVARPAGSSTTQKQPSTTKGAPMDQLRKIGEDDDLEMDSATQAVFDDLPDTDVSEYGDIDPREPIVIPGSGEDDGALPSVKPKAPDKDAALDDLHRALISLHRENPGGEFGNADVHDRMRYEWSGPELSRRFTALTQDATLNPPGLKLERVGVRGRFILIPVVRDSE